MTLKEMRDIVRVLIRDFGATESVYGTGTGTLIVTTASGVALSDSQIDEALNDVWMARQMDRGGHYWSLSSEAFRGTATPLVLGAWNQNISSSFQINEVAQVFLETSASTQCIGPALEQLDPEEIQGLFNADTTPGSPVFWGIEKGGNHAPGSAPLREHRLLWYPPVDGGTYHLSAKVKLDPFKLADDADRVYVGYSESWQTLRAAAARLANALSYDQDKIDALLRFADSREPHLVALREGWS